MPQMSPMNWTSLYIYFLMMFILLMVLSFFFYTPKCLFSKFYKKEKKMINWKW